jgi:hypothetical protein
MSGKGAEVKGAWQNLMGIKIGHFSKYLDEVHWTADAKASKLNWKKPGPESNRGPLHCWSGEKPHAYVLATIPPATTRSIKDRTK